MTLIDLKVKTECLQKINRAKISDGLQYVRVGLVTNPETAQSTGPAMLLEPYLSREPLGDTSDEGPGGLFRQKKQLRLALESHPRDSYPKDC